MQKQALGGCMGEGYGRVADSVAQLKLVRKEGIVIK
jgi:hypothetical protein